MGMGALGLTGVMGDALGAAMRSAGKLDSPLAPRKPHFAAKAKRVIHLFLNGGPSHVDTFDHKPALDKYHGQELPKSMHLVTERRTGAVLRSPFKFKRCGKSGIEVSELFPHVGECIDDIAVTNLDGLDSVDSIKVCTHYVSGRRKLDVPPTDSTLLAHCRPAYLEFPGWKQSTSGAKRWDDLPANARAYLEAIARFSGARLSIVSVGPGRDQTILL